MSNTNAAPATPTAPAPEANGSGVTVIPSLEDRANAAFGMSEPAAEVTGDPPSSASAAGSVVPTDIDAKRAERRAALRALQDGERSRVDTITAIRERDELRQRLQAIEAERQKTAGHIDPSSLDEAAFFALGERAKIEPTKLYEWMRERMANPELAAAQAASRAVDPKIAALEKRVEAAEARNAAYEQAQQSARAEAEERQAAEQFFAYTRGNAESAPLTAAFLEKFGPTEFHKLALGVVPKLPPGAGPQAVLDEIEENLSYLGAVYRAQPATPQRSQANPPAHSAAASAPIVSNSLAQQRSSVIDEDENWAALPFEERSARAFR